MAGDNSTVFEIPDFNQRLETYIGDDKAAQVKDIYKLLLSRLQEHENMPKTILDVGCATGDLLSFLASALPEAELCGLDIEPNLVDVARQRPELADATIHVGDILNTSVGEFDMVCFFGVLGIFDTFEEPLTKLVSQVKAGGCVYVQALLNPDDIDVRIAYRDNLNDMTWMRGFNIFSRARVKKWCEENGLEVEFIDFHMSNEIEKRENLPHRAYTVDLADGTRRTTNGLCLLLPETLMKISVPA